MVILTDNATNNLFNSYSVLYVYTVASYVRMKNSASESAASIPHEQLLPG